MTLRNWIRQGTIVVAVLAVIGGVVLAAVLARGFRATSTPTSLEAAVARRVRNFAIPSRNRNEKQPLDATPDNIEAGHDRFMAQCASCHGTAADARSRMGQNLYPRAPDLQSARTQSLTDGELHYIIENGVQLTGMPAWTPPHAANGSETWQLVLYIRSLTPKSGAESVAQHAAIAGATYTGSHACARCHQSIYEHWQKTPMANVVRDPREHPDAIIPNLATNTTPAKFTKDQVTLVYGSLWKQRYFTQVGDDLYPLGAQWDVQNKTWRPYLVPKGTDWWTAYYPPDNLKRPTGPLCDGCHSVGYDITKKKPVEWNVGCERCHGPGSAHVEHPTRANIISPARMNYVDANDTCIQCHSQGRTIQETFGGTYYDWPVGYNVGLRLSDFWRLEPFSYGAPGGMHFADGTADKNRMQGNDYVQSVMYERGVTCFSCHDVHGTDQYAQLRKPANKICLDCHAPAGPNGPRETTLAAHTRHKDGSTGSECIACHMPKIQTEGMPGVNVRAHTFRFVTPAMTDKYKIPNPCSTCHTGKSAEWAAQEMRHWPERSPWRGE